MSYKFIFGFVMIIAISFSIIAVVDYLGEGGSEIIIAN